MCIIDEFFKIWSTKLVPKFLWIHSRQPIERYFLFLRDQYRFFGVCHETRIQDYLIFSWLLVYDFYQIFEITNMSMNFMTSKYDQATFSGPKFCGSTQRTSAWYFLFHKDQSCFLEFRGHKTRIQDHLSFSSVVHEIFKIQSTNFVWPHFWI